MNRIFELLGDLASSDPWLLAGIGGGIALVVVVFLLNRAARVRALRRAVRPSRPRATPEATGEDEERG